jgi:RNA polymerase primary sigma factor
MTSSSSWFLDQAGRHQLLTPEQELTLGRQVQAWLTDPQPSPATIRCGRRARDQMVACNLRMVVTIANQYRVHVGAAIGMEDLIQGGNEGLLRAVEKFDPTRGYRFSTYAYWWIRQSVVKALADNGRTIRMPLTFAGKLLELDRAQQRLVIALGREPTRPELAQEMNLRLEQLDAALSIGRRPASLDRLVGDDAAPLGEMLAAPEDEPEDPRAAELRDRLETLNPLAAELIRLRHGVDCVPQSIADAAAAVGVSASRARQLLTQARKALKDPALQVAGPPPGVEAVGDGQQLAINLPLDLPGTAEPIQNAAGLACEGSAVRRARPRRIRAQQCGLLPGLGGCWPQEDLSPSAPPAPGAEPVASVAGCAASPPV